MTARPLPAHNHSHLVKTWCPGGPNTSSPTITAIRSRINSLHKNGFKLQQSRHYQTRLLPQGLLLNTASFSSKMHFELWILRINRYFQEFGSDIHLIPIPVNYYYLVIIILCTRYPDMHHWLLVNSIRKSLCFWAGVAWQPFSHHGYELEWW